MTKPEFTSVNIQNLGGQALNWAVAECLGIEYRYKKSVGGDYNGHWWWAVRDYTTNAGAALEIMQRENIGFLPAGKHRGGLCLAFIYEPTQHDLAIEMTHAQSGPDILTAAMRCFVYKTMGDTIAVPKDLL